MKPIEKTAEDLFQKLRNRFDPVEMGDENAEETTDPTQARIFSFLYKEGENDVGYVSISIVANRSFKVYYGTDVTDRVENKNNWYTFLKDLRMFAKRNLMSFDARDLAKNQLEPRDFKFISNQDGTYKDHEVEVSESVMFGSRRKSYQTMENVKMIVNHRKSIDETIPGARSRYIESIYLERADGERYKFPYNYLTGARAMARHVNEGGNPYDDMGKHIIEMIKEMRDLSKFARRTKKYAMEDENAGNIRNHVVERFHSMKKQLGAMSVKEGYSRFVENFKTEEAIVEDDAVQQIKERFTQQVFDTQLEDTLPAVMKAIKEAEMNQLAEKEGKPIMALIKTKPLVLRKDDAADQMFRSTKFTDGAGLLGFILSDIAGRAIGDGADEIANFASDAAERVQDRDYDPADKQTAMALAKKYMDDVKKMAADPAYADEVRVDPKAVYGAKKKRTGGFHEAEALESWANELVPEEKVDELHGKGDLEKIKNYHTNRKNAANKNARNMLDNTGPESTTATFSGEMGKYDVAKANINRANKLIDRRDKNKTTESGFYRPGERTGSAEGAKQAILWRIKNQHLDLIKQYGLDKVLQAVDDEAMYLDNLEEIGSSDISAWVNNIKRNLAADYPNSAGDEKVGEAKMSKNEKWAYNQGRSRSLMKDKGDSNPSTDDKENDAFKKGLKHYAKEDYDPNAADDARKLKSLAKNNAYMPKYSKDIKAIAKRQEKKAVTGMEEDYDPNAAVWSKKFADNSRFAKSQSKADHLYARINPEYKKEKEKEAKRYNKMSKDYANKAVTGMDEGQVNENWTDQDYGRLDAVIKNLESKGYQIKGIMHWGYSDWRSSGDEPPHAEITAVDPHGHEKSLYWPKGSKQKYFDIKEAGTVGTTGTVGPTGQNVTPAQALRDPNLQKNAKNVSRVAQAAGIKTNPNQIAQTMANQAAGKPLTPQSKATTSNIGNTVMQAAANDPKKAAQLTAMMKKMTQP